MKIAIRILLLPVGFILQLIPHVIGLTINLYRWVRYGGEFVIYTGDDKASMAKIYTELKKLSEYRNPPETTGNQTAC